MILQMQELQKEESKEEMIQEKLKTFKFPKNFINAEEK